MLDELTTKEVAKLYGVTPRRIRAKIKDGHFPNARLCRACLCYFIPVKDLTETFEKEDIDEFIKKKIKGPK